MSPAPRYPRSYENKPARAALARLVETPSLEVLDELLAAALRGGLVVDVSGSSDPADPALRTISSTDGRLVLPLFTSIKELQATVAAAGGKGEQVRALIVPGRQALGFVSTADFVAVQFNPRTPGGVVAREHVDRALGTGTGTDTDTDTDT